MESPPKQHFKSYPAVVCLITMNLAAFLLLPIAVGSKYASNPVHFGANYGPLTLSGEWWRLVSSIFVHIELLHLLGNMVVLWLLGSRLERAIGSLRFLIVFLFCGIVGNIAVLIAAPFSLSYGASAGVGGAAGGLVCVYANRAFQKRQRIRLTLWIVVVAVYLVLMAMSDKNHVIHLSSVVAGLVLTFMFLRFWPGGMTLLNAPHLTPDKPTVPQLL